MRENWDEVDEFLNDNRNCGQGMENNDGLDDDEKSICDFCASTNIQWEHYDDCIDRDHVGTLCYCFKCKKTWLIG